MKPIPWSYTSLDDFVNCPRAYHAKRVEKSVVEHASEQMLWGSYVHKVFEDRIKLDKAIPEELKQHERFMQIQATRPGVIQTEQKIALNKQLQPTTFFAKDVWFRGVLDYNAVSGRVATIVDYKTGKPHKKFSQLKLFALWIFAQYPDVQMVHTMYYWTTTETTTTEVYTREQIRDLWRDFTPNLVQYREAFLANIWQPRPSGLCNGWCPVTSCEFWRPKRPKR
jgi:hypothetical protein